MGWMKVVGRRLQWVGHIHRMRGEIDKETTETEEDGIRRTGRPEIR